jgi:hypothetical protein
MKKLLIIMMLCIAGVASAQQRFGEMPCQKNEGKIDDDAGYPLTVEGEVFKTCTFAADNVAIKIYKIGLCKRQPVISYENVADLSMCSFVYENDAGAEVVLSQGSPLALSNLKRPDNGVYPYFLFLLSNTVKFKASAEFYSDRNTTGSYADGSGSFCYTVAGGTKCASSIGSDYDYNQYSIDTSDEMQGAVEDVVFGGSTIEYFTDSALKKVSCYFEDPDTEPDRRYCPPSAVTSRWFNIYDPVNDLVIRDATRGLRLEVNISHAVGLMLDPDTDEVQQINDAPFAYRIEAIE